MYKQGIIIKTDEEENKKLMYKKDVGTPEGRTGIRLMKLKKNKRRLQKDYFIFWKNGRRIVFLFSPYFPYFSFLFLFYFLLFFLLFDTPEGRTDVRIKKTRNDGRKIEERWKIGERLEKNERRMKIIVFCCHFFFKIIHINSE